MLKKSSFLKSMILLNFPIQWYLNILNLFNILMILNKWIFWWFSSMLLRDPYLNGYYSMIFIWCYYKISKMARLKNRKQLLFFCDFYRYFRPCHFVPTTQPLWLVGTSGKKAKSLSLWIWPKPLQWVRY